MHVYYICGHSGQYFGELGLLFPIERTASAVAATFCDVFCLRYEDLHNIMKGEKLYKQFDIIKEIRIVNISPILVWCIELKTTFSVAKYLHLSLKLYFTM